MANASMAEIGEMASGCKAGRCMTFLKACALKVFEAAGRRDVGLHSPLPQSFPDADLVCKVNAASVIVITERQGAADKRKATPSTTLPVIDSTRLPFSGLPENWIFYEVSADARSTDAQAQDIITVAETLTGAVHLVGYGFGGLVALRALSLAREKAGLIGRVLTVGAPINGSATARLSGKDCPEDIRYGVPVPRDHLELGVIAGHVPGQPPSCFSGLGGDGVVFLDETRPSGLPHHYLEVNVAHEDMASHPDVIEAASSFLTFGVFGVRGHLS